MFRPNYNLLAFFITELLRKHLSENYSISMQPFFPSLGHQYGGHKIDFKTL